MAVNVMAVDPMMAVNTMAVNNTSGDLEHEGQTLTVEGRAGATTAGAIHELEEAGRRGAVAATISEDWGVYQRYVLEVEDANQTRGADWAGVGRGRGDGRVEDWSLMSQPLFEHDQLPMPRLQQIEAEAQDDVRLEIQQLQQVPRNQSLYHDPPRTIPLPNPVILQPQPIPNPALQFQQTIPHPARWEPIATQQIAQRPQKEDSFLDNQEGQIDRRNLKLKTFKGNNIMAWKLLFDEFSEQFNWSEKEKKLRLKAHVDDWIRAMFTDLPPETTAEEMMSRLVSRFGINMTSTEVENALLKIERKSDEDLYTLADRVRNLINRAYFPEKKKRAIMRQAFFTALRGNSKLQHFVNRYDDPDNPDMNNTLDLAIEWEHRHGTTFKAENNVESDRSADVTIELEGEQSDDGDTRIGCIPLHEMTTKEGRLLAAQNNAIYSYLKEQDDLSTEEEWSRKDRRVRCRSSSFATSRSSSCRTTSTCSPSPERKPRRKSRNRHKKPSRNQQQGESMETHDFSTTCSDSESNSEQLTE